MPKRNKTIVNIHYSWDDIDYAVTNIVKQIKKDNLKFDGIFAVPRGGLILGAYLSNILNLPMLLAPTNDTLVTDDISDFGITLTPIKHKKIACIFTTPWTTVIPDYYCFTKSLKNTWIVMPYEVFNNSKRRNTS